MQREWRLKSFLGMLLVATLFSTLGLVSSAILLLEHLPSIARENSQLVRHDAKSVAQRMELLMDALLARLKPFEVALQAIPAEISIRPLLDAVTGDGSSLSTLYIVSPDGIVEDVGFSTSQRSRYATEMVGSDLSSNPLYQAVRAQRHAVWSDRYLSLMSNNITVGVGLPVGERVIIGEINLEYLLDALRDTRFTSTESVWIIDQRGEVIGDTASPSQAGLINLLGLPLVQQALRNPDAPLPATFTYRGRSYYVAAAHSKTLNWLFLVKAPAGLGDARIRANLVRAIVSLSSLLLVSLLLAPLWAERLAQPVTALLRYARQMAGGGKGGAWPRGSIVEFNRLSLNLERMAQAILEREQKASAIFNATPVAMMVCDADDHFAVIDTNQAWSEQFGYSRTEVLGRRVLDIHLSLAKTECIRLFQSTRNMSEQQDVWLLHQDGRVLLCAVSAQQIKVNNHRLMIWVMDDVTERRRNERELRVLNAELEQRVAQRTSALHKANQESSEALRNLRTTQRELIEAGKMAALGELVAGVAHELNTPIGNGLMAASTLNDVVREFERAMHSGLRRSMLDEFVNQSRTAAQILVRNLQRAAELVSSFKQVAVDRTSSQRRSFDLGEMVQEILVTLHPTLKRTPHQISMQVLAGIQLDSYPGPLGQVLTNLINNAVTHAFDSGAAGTILISASASDERVQLQVSDNGKGIPPALRERIFHPFVTTRLGRGGTGLGLHIAYNIVTNLLGGRLTVHSEPGQGTRFEIWIPKQAPLTAVQPESHEKQEDRC